MPGFSIQVFLPDGDPEGLRIVTKSHWTGQATMTKRDRLEADLKRPEFSRTGVYVLIGPGQDNPAGTRVYVGEGDEVISRIKSHAIAKDFWTELVAFTKTDNSLNKADIRYLESQLVKRAQSANRAELDNGNSPDPAAPTEAEKADLESFLVDILVILRLLGISAFDPIETVGPDLVATDLFSFSAAGTSGSGYPTKDGFIVLAGSKARVANTQSISDGYRNLRVQLVADGVLVPGPPGDEHYTFATDYVFGSSSAAGAVLYGGMISGPQNWTRASDGKTIKQLEEASLATVVVAPPAEPAEALATDGPEPFQSVN